MPTIIASVISDLKMRAPNDQVRRGGILEPLEARRLLTAELSFGHFALSGWGIFHPGHTSTVVAIIRNLGNTPVSTAFSVTFKAVAIPLNDDGTHASYDDPGAIVLSTSTVSKTIPALSADTSVSFDIKFPTRLN